MRHYLAGFLMTICAAAGATHPGRIYGGQDATPGQFPFMVVLNDDDRQYCNGVIVAPSWILTAAFCMFYVSPAAEVYAGSPINEANGNGSRFSERVAHPDYEDWILKNDIALLRINTVLEYGETIQPVELGVAPAPDSTCTMMGWGLTETEDFPSLQYVDTTIIDLPTCQSVSENESNQLYLGPEQICSQNSPGQGACAYDFGGALLCDGKLSGIFSYYVGSCGRGTPDVFTNIETYSDWILSYI